MFCALLPILIVVREVHPEKTGLSLTPIVLQLVALKFTSFRPVQCEKAEPPMLITALGMVILVKPVQSENAQPPMLVTELGMVMLVRPLQP